MAQLLSKLQAFIISHQLIKPGESLLVAVSGGIDSMFLLNYLITNKYKLAVAHCNFGLRGLESDMDEKFLKLFCKANKIKFYSKNFETETYSKTMGISIQMAARDLRYLWFNELCEAHNFKKIITAHHKTDNVETILLNMVRGTGYKGMGGMALHNGNKIRPLLCLNKTEIEALVKKLKISYREDQSNKSEKYYRNLLRLKVLPELKKLNPDFENTFAHNADIARQTNRFIDYFLNKIESEIVSLKGDRISIDINKLLNLPESKFILFNLLSQYGFNTSDTEGIFLSLTGISGKQFFSIKYRLIKDRGQLIIEPNKPNEHLVFKIQMDTNFIETPHHQWQFEILKSFKKITALDNKAYLDINKLVFPLTLRLLQKGDKMIPLGMKGHKKVSDILIDKKISVLEKEKIWAVISDNCIVWLSGLVINDDFKVTKNTTSVYKIYTTAL